MSVTAFRLWAPRAGHVELCLGGRRITMTPQGDGWWHLAEPSVEPGADYAFALDGGPPLPDPRSPWQPAGGHGPSRVLDHGAFAWGDTGWQPPPLAAGVIYELHVGTFTPTGTFEGVLDRLDHLASLGVTHVELMPVVEFPGTRGWGYDGVDLFAPHHGYGGPIGLKRLVDGCHRRGLAVILDVVYNHLGPSGNYLGQFAPYFTDRYRTPWGEAVNLDGADSDEVRRFLCDNAIMWLRDYHVDGLRIDAVHAMLDGSATHVLEQLAAEVRALEAHLGRHLALIAESDLNDPRLIQAPAAGGYGLDAQWNEDFHHALHALLTGERHGYYADFGGIADVATSLQEGFVYAGRYSAYRRRRHGRPASGLGGHRLVGCLQNHDQVGNRPRGDRMSHLVSRGRVMIGAALVLTAPFVPMLFQGEEWGARTPFLYFTDHDDPALGEAVRDGRRREFAAFGWDEDMPDPQAATTFERSRLDWTEPAREPHASLMDWHRRLIRLRRRHPELADGRMDLVHVAHDDRGGWMRIERRDITVAVNLASWAQPVSVPPGRPRRVLLASRPDIALRPDAVELPPDAVAVLGP